MGPVSWTYPAEIVSIYLPKSSYFEILNFLAIQYSLKVRGKAVALATATNWLFNTALAWAVPPGLATIAWKTYFIFGTFNFAACIHIFFMYPETVGRTLEEVEEIFQQGHVFTAWQIGKDVGKKTLEEVVGESKHNQVRFRIVIISEYPFS